jgi:hypothetical protein
LVTGFREGFAVGFAEGFTEDFAEGFTEDFTEGFLVEDAPVEVGDLVGFTDGPLFVGEIVGAAEGSLVGEREGAPSGADCADEPAVSATHVQMSQFC